MNCALAPIDHDEGECRAILISCCSPTHHTGASSLCSFSSHRENLFALVPTYFAGLFLRIEAEQERESSETRASLTFFLFVSLVSHGKQGLNPSSFVRAKGCGLPGAN
jgi:hypothetical protein